MQCIDISYLRENYLKDFIEEDTSNNPFHHLNISDMHYAVRWDSPEDEETIKKLFLKIRNEDCNYRKQKMIMEYISILDRKYNNQTIDETYLCPAKVGRKVDRVTVDGIRAIALMVTGEDSRIFPWMAVGSGTSDVTFGDTALETELVRTNVITDRNGGFLDPLQDGWTASGAFPRTTPTPANNNPVSEIGMMNSSNELTSKMFDRTVLSLNDRIDHLQNQDSFTVTSLYILTSI